MSRFLFTSTLPLRQRHIFSWIGIHWRCIHSFMPLREYCLFSHARLHIVAAITLAAAIRQEYIRLPIISFTLYYTPHCHYYGLSLLARHYITPYHYCCRHIFAIVGIAAFIRVLLPLHCHYIRWNMLSYTPLRYHHSFRWRLSAWHISHIPFHCHISYAAATPRRHICLSTRILRWLHICYIIATIAIITLLANTMSLSSRHYHLLHTWHMLTSLFSY